MGLSKNALKPGVNIYIDYPIEEVLFRWDGQLQCVYKKFYGEEEGPEAIPTSNKLFFDALNFGVQIDEAAYRSGKS